MNNYFDCVVAGFGTAGVVAAIAAAERGISVLALEKTGCPGGTHLGGFIGGDYIQKATGLYAELDDLPSLDNASNLERRKHAIEERARKAGVIVVYNATVFDVIKSGNQVCGVKWVDDADVVHEIRCRTVIDSTAEAVVSVAAGCEIRKGRDGDGAFQPFANSMAIALNNGNCSLLNWDSGRIDQTDTASYSRALLETIVFSHLREDYSRHRELMTAPELPGIREGVHVVTQYTQTLKEALTPGFKVADPIFYAWTNIDTHARDLPLEGELYQEWNIGCSMWGVELCFPVSLRTLLPLGVGGLLVAARHFGVDHDLGHALRMNPCMGAIGEVAGIIAALAVKMDLAPEAVPYSAVKKELNWAEPKVTPVPGWHQRLDVAFREGNPDALGKKSEQIQAELATDAPGGAIWSSRYSVSSEDLRSWYDNSAENSNMRCHTAFALALRGDAYGVAELRKMVAERDEFRPTLSRKYNHARGYVAVFYLGKLRDLESIDLLFGVLEEAGELKYEYQTLAITALLKIGETHVAVRARVADKLRAKAEDPRWYLEARLKGTADKMKRMDPLFRVTIAKTLNSWGISHRIGEVFQQLSPDAYEIHLAAVNGVLK